MPSNPTPESLTEWMDGDYPTAAALKRVRTWEIKSNADVAALLDFVRGLWIYDHYFDYEPDWISLPDHDQRRKPFGVSTGGWSGHESVIDALTSNDLFWMCCWLANRRGGHYVFDAAPFTEPTP